MAMSFAFNMRCILGYTAPHADGRWKLRVVVCGTALARVAAHRHVSAQPAHDGDLAMRSRRGTRFEFAISSTL
jgi:hypothetical protein